MLFGYFLARILKILLSYLKSALLNFVYLQNLIKKLKCQDSGPEMPDLGIFDSNVKIILSYSKSPPSHLSNCKIWPGNKNAQIWDQKSFIWIFLTKNVLFGYVSVRILKILVPYLKSTSSSLSISKIGPLDQILILVFLAGI